jgi:mevalonate kinase
MTKASDNLVERVARAIDDALPESDELTLAPSQIKRAAIAAIEATHLEEVVRLREALKDAIDLLKQAGFSTREHEAALTLFEVRR